MQKYENIVGQLSENTKIELLTNLVGMSDCELEAIGLSNFKVERLEEIIKTVYPTPKTLACSWNEELARDIGRASGDISSARGAKFLIAPSPKIKFDPYGSADCEDATLGGSLALAYALGARESGLGICVAGMGVSREDAKWLGDPPDESVTREYIARQYADIANCADKGIAIGVCENLNKDNFDNLSTNFVAAVGSTATDARFVCESAGAADTVKLLNAGVSCLQGAGYALSAALRKYEVVKRAVDKGELEESELEAQIKCGDAISPQMLDEAVVRLLELIDACQPRFTSIESAKEKAAALAYRAASESIVLIKNSAKTLPISKKKKIAVIGDVINQNGEEYRAVLCKQLEEKGAKIVGYAKGYDLAADATDSKLTKEALALAKKSDIVLFFVGTDSDRERYIASTKNLSLPANQDMLASELRKSGVCSVALLCSNYPVDIIAIEELSALMSVPCASASDAIACADILMGAVSPSGKLANTLYRNTDRAFLRRLHRLGCNRSAGRFIGYRYYDSADYDVGFPFGHGLSYTKFDYSAFSVSGGKISLTVKNSGNMSGADVVQIYAGLDDSNALRPKRELIAFKKIFLEAGQCAKLSFDLKLPPVFDGKSGAMCVQSGKYMLYASSSLTEVKQIARIDYDGVKLDTPDESRSRYLLNESNIITDNYTLEARYPTMKRPIKNIICGAALLIVAVLLQIYCVSTNTASAFLNILTVIVLGIAIAFFILDSVDRKRIADNERELAERENKKWFEDATHLESFDTDKMFEEHFDDKEPEVEENAEEVILADVANEYLSYVDKNMTLADASQEFERFAFERGCKLDKSTVYTLLGALASSKFILINGLNKDEFAALSAVLCQYLECNFHLDIADSSYTNPSSLFVRADENGIREKRGALRTLEEAGASLSELHVAPIAQVNIEILKNCFDDVVKYAKSPTLPAFITDNGEKYRFSHNVLFLVGLDMQRTLAELPENIAEIATVCDVKLALTDRAQNFTEAKKLKLYQLDYMAERAAADRLLDEEQWKKLDALERYVGYRTGYSIGNKRWISIEKYASVYVSAGGDASDALDKAISSKLLPSIVCTCKQAKNSSEINLGEALDSIFGENEMDGSRRALRNAHIYVKDQGETNA